MNPVLSMLSAMSILASCLIISGFSQKPAKEENSAPLVRITMPPDKSFFKRDAVLNYSISVEDKEDGNSAYNEIPANEVLLKVVYLADMSHLNKNAAINAGLTNTPRALSFIMQSNCFNCHAVKNKLIGPSFEQIAKRYPYSPASADMLMKKVINGSTGIWGTTPMPSHPEIKTDQLKEIVNWILKSSADPAVCYYPGLEGTFRTGSGPGKAPSKEGYVLVASYTDHGLKDMPRTAKRGIHVIVLRPSPRSAYRG